MANPFLQVKEVLRLVQMANHFLQEILVQVAQPLNRTLLHERLLKQL
tara:strand:- start:191 stop:331 length:141 start_codon:yes stop_codon:yes gene_type:complete